jgi:hypothetical protein
VRGLIDLRMLRFDRAADPPKYIEVVGERESDATPARSRMGTPRRA